MKFDDVLDEAYYIINSYNVNLEDPLFRKSFRKTGHREVKHKDKDKVKEAEKTNKTKRTKRFKRRKVSR